LQILPLLCKHILELTIFLLFIVCLGL
jgi:hypothetical protein